MKNYLSRISSLSFSFLLILALVIPVNANLNLVYIEGLDSNQIKNSEAKSILDNLMLVNSRSTNQDGMKVFDTKTLEDIVTIAENSSNLVEVYKYQDRKVSDRILYDSLLNVYVLFEEDHIENTATLTINNTTFELKAEKFDRISFFDSVGSELVIYEEVVDKDFIGQFSKISSSSFSTQVASRAATWINKSGPFHKSSKMNFEVLSWVGTVASGLTLNVTGPLGTVLFLYGLAVSIGQTISPTIHIQFFLENRSDCLSYHRETRYYYGAYSEISKTFYERINNLNGSAKVTYSQFHSIDPYQTGGACMGYN